MHSKFFATVILNTVAGPPMNQQLIVSHIQPFGSRVDIEIIKAPQPISPKRTADVSPYTDGSPTTYIHFIINQVRPVLSRGSVSKEVDRHFRATN